MEEKDGALMNMNKEICGCCGSDINADETFYCNVCKSYVCSRCWNTSFNLCSNCEIKVTYKVHSYVNGILNGMGLRDGDKLRDALETKMLLRYIRSYAGVAV